MCGDYNITVLNYDCREISLDKAIADGMNVGRGENGAVLIEEISTRIFE